MSLHISLYDKRILNNPNIFDRRNSVVGIESTSLAPPCSQRKPAVACRTQTQPVLTFSCWVVHAFRRAADINFLVEVRLCVWAAAVSVGMTRCGPAPLFGGGRANRPHIGAQIHPCALLHQQVCPVPGIGRSTGAQTASVARFPLRISHRAPDCFRQISAALAKLTSLLSAFHHNHDLETSTPQESASRQKPRRWFSGWRGVCV